MTIDDDDALGCVGGWLFVNLNLHVEYVIIHYKMGCLNHHGGEGHK